jgi:hypothetical protein
VAEPGSVSYFNRCLPLSILTLWNCHWCPWKVLFLLLWLPLQWLISFCSCLKSSRFLTSSKAIVFTDFLCLLLDGFDSYLCSHDFRNQHFCPRHPLKGSNFCVPWLTKSRLHSKYIKSIYFPQQPCTFSYLVLCPRIWYHQPCPPPKPEIWEAPVTQPCPSPPYPVSICTNRWYFQHSQILTALSLVLILLPTVPCLKPAYQFFVLFCLWLWGRNSGPAVCQASALPLSDTSSPSFLVLGFH